MKKLLWIVTGVILIIAAVLGMEFWKETQTINRETESLIDLRRILTLAENRGADWATDELMIDNIETFRKKSLYKKWGEPTEKEKNDNEDIWILSDEFKLIVDYDDREHIEKVRIVSGS